MYLDVIVSKNIRSPAHIAIKVFQTPQPTPEVVYAAAISSGATFTIGLSEDYLVISQPPHDPLSPGEVFKLSDISEDKLDYIWQLLTPPDELPQGESPRFPPGHHPNQSKLTRWLFSESEITPEYRSEIRENNFELNLDEYAELLYDAYSSSSANEKGDSLEDVTEFLFKGLKGVSIKDKNLRTRSREIDIVLEYSQNPTNPFNLSSRFALVECKNKEGSMNVQEVDNFVGNLRETGVDLGIIVSWNGISGEDSGRNAAGAINNQKNRFEIITITSQDLYRILDGKSLHDIIGERLYAQQFNL